MQSQNNTSSNFLLPSEFRKVWEDFGKESVGDIFVDFFDDFILTMHLLQEIMLISHLHFKEELKNLTNKIMKILEIKNLNKSYSFIEKNIKPIILEYYEDIFENENKSDYFYNKIKEDYANFVNKKFLTDTETDEKLHNNFNNNNDHNQIKALAHLKPTTYIKSDKADELRELLRSNYIKDFLKTVKKIFLFVEFHEPQLSLKLEPFEKRKLLVKEMKQSDCVLADGYIKDVRNCLILLDPPLLKNGYPYSGLKPIALICPDDFKSGESNNNYNNNNNKNDNNISNFTTEKKLNNFNEQVLKDLLVTDEAPNSKNEEKAIIEINHEKAAAEVSITHSNNSSSDNKGFTIPLKKDEKLSSTNRSKLSEIEKKEKIIQMILDSSDKDRDISYNTNIHHNINNGSIEFVSFNKNTLLAAEKKNDLEIIDCSKKNKNRDVAFSRNPNTSSSKDFSRNDSKNYIQSIITEAEKLNYNFNENHPQNGKNTVDKKIEKSSKGFLPDYNNHQEEKT